jgi:hypothetical protein
MLVNMTLRAGPCRRSYLGTAIEFVMFAFLVQIVKKVPIADCIMSFRNDYRDVRMSNAVWEYYGS